MILEEILSSSNSNWPSEFDVQKRIAWNVGRYPDIFPWTIPSLNPDPNVTVFIVCIFHHIASFPSIDQPSDAKATCRGTAAG